MSDRFREARLAAGLSLGQAAEAAEVGRTTVYDAETRSRPRLDVASRLADVYGVSLDWLAGRRDEGGPQSPADEGLVGMVMAWLAHKAQLAEDAGDTDGQWLIESLRLAIGGGALGRYVAGLSDEGLDADRPGEGR